MDCDGEGGFGWDAIFQPNSADKTFAMMSIEEKNKVLTLVVVDVAHALTALATVSTVYQQCINSVLNGY